MKKEKNIPASYRLPESLLNDLRFVAGETEKPQIAIVRDGLQTKVESIKKQIQRKKEKELEAVAA